jgi:hypothetical protein
MMDDLKYVVVQAALPTERNPQGWAAEAWYTIAEGVVTLTDAAGRPYEGLQHKLEPGEDAKAVAKRLLRRRILRAPERRHRGPIVFPKIDVA